MNSLTKSLLFLTALLLASCINKDNHEAHKETLGDDIVAAHYGVGLFFINKETDKKTSPKWSKITHTWKRYGDKWLIITGMSADLDKSPD